jgi:hypothetical protein
MGARAIDACTATAAIFDVTAKHIGELALDLQYLMPEIVGGASAEQLDFYRARPAGGLALAVNPEPVIAVAQRFHRSG